MTLFPLEFLGGGLEAGTEGTTDGKGGALLILLSLVLLSSQGLKSVN